jgi:hypothetical protein
MKNFLLTLLLFTIFNSALFAQSQMEKAANFAADYICNCVNEVYSEIEPEIRDFIFKIYSLPEDEQSDFILSLSEEQQIKIVNQADIMSSESKAAEMDLCNNNMIADLERKFADMEDDENFDEAELMNSMLERLSKKTRCEFAYLLLVIGLEQQD